MDLKIPSAEQYFLKIKERIIQDDLIIFLDFDGTLAPIVENPPDAKILPCIKDTIEILTSKFQIYIISGRSRLDVKEKVGISNCKFVGAHGFDMSEIHSQEIVSQDVLNMIQDVFEQFKKEFGSIEGVILENHHFTLTIHYRKVKDISIHEHLFEKVKKIMINYHNLKITFGKMVIEIRPKIDWNKGKAVEKILQEQSNKFSIYLGDDITDEDAFKYLKDSNKGIGILIGDKKETNAFYSLQDPHHVSKFLKLLK